MEGRGAVIYCDSSFLVPLYLYEAGRSDEARQIASRWTEPAVISLLGELEWINALGRKVTEKEITNAESGQLVREFKQDLKSGIFCWPPLNLAVMFRDAVQLSLRHTPAGGYRSLDILHVAAAKLCGAKQFLSFDERLNRLAKAEAMVILGAGGEL